MTPEEIRDFAKKLVGSTAGLTQGNAGAQLAQAVAPPPVEQATLRDQTSGGVAPGYDAVDLEDSSTAVRPPMSPTAQAALRVGVAPKDDAPPAPTSPAQPPPMSSPEPSSRPSFAALLDRPPEPRAQQDSTGELQAAFEADDAARKRADVSKAFSDWAYRRPNTPRAEPSQVQRMQQMSATRASDAKVNQSAAMADPNSAESQQAREIFGSTPTGQAMKKQLGPLWDKMPARLIPGVDDVLKYANKSNDPTLGALHEAEAENLRSLSADRMGKATEAQKERQGEPARVAATVEALVGAGRITPKEAEALSKVQTMKDLQTALGQKAPKVAGPAGPTKGMPSGWVLDGSTRPTETQASDFEGLVTSDITMRLGTAKMREMLKQAGASRVWSPGKRKEIAQLAKQIAIQVKNVAGLGALSGPDMGLVDAIIGGDQTALTSFLADPGVLLNGLDEWGARSVEGKARGIGAHKGSAAAGAPRGPVKMQFPDGSVHDVDPEDVDMAINKKGGKPVKGG